MSCVRVAVSIALTLMATTLTATARPPADEVSASQSTPAPPPGTAGSERDEGKPESSPIIVAQCDVWDGGGARAHAPGGGIVPTVATPDPAPFAEVTPARPHISAVGEPTPLSGQQRCRLICRHPNAPPVC